MLSYGLWAMLRVYALEAGDAVASTDIELAKRWDEVSAYAYKQAWEASFRLWEPKMLK